MTTGTIPLYDRDGREKIFSLDEHARMVGNGRVGPGREWSSVKPLPEGWNREVPRYRVARYTPAPAKARFRFEMPFTESVDDSWQFGDRAYSAGEIVETRQWPARSFIPLNDVAKKITECFASRMKSRLPRTPFDHRGALRLDDGLSGPATPDVRPPDVKPMDLRPVA